VNPAQSTAIRIELPGTLRVTCPPPAAEAACSPAASSAMIGVAILVGAELMFFGGLVTAFLVLRAGAPWWPPPGQPRLPVVVTGINTVILLLSGVIAHKALRALERDERQILVRRLGLAAVLGAFFVMVQGYEWARLLEDGLRVSSGIYGALFVTIVGAHALHVIGGMLALLAVLWMAAKGRYSRDNCGGVEACCLFWSFVVLLWPILYVLVYLS
jgi:cytochrome c oxidase subunit 3